MKKLLIIPIMLFALNVNAQITRYHKTASELNYVSEVEDMTSDEIVNYNKWIKEGHPKVAVIGWINALRTLHNLKSAPATVIDYFFRTVEPEDASEMKLEEGTAYPLISLINTTAKNIRVARLTFEFYNEGGNSVFDIHSGRKSLTLTFKDLCGRTNSSDYKQIATSILDCDHQLSLDDAVGYKIFVNKKIDHARLTGVSITYDNGTVSHSAAVAEYDDGLPIDPIRYYADTYKVDWDAFKTNGEKNPEDPAGIASTTKTGNESTDESMTFNGHRITMTEVPAPPPPASGYNGSPRGNYEPRAYTIVERMPSFKGNINQWLAQNVNYPKDAAEKGIQGRVIVRFIVGKDGTVSDASIVRGVDPELDREALRVTMAMPKWNPGYNNGKTANVWFTYPIIFKLQ